MTGAAPTVHLAASPGGHLDLLKMVHGAFDGYRRVWLTGAGRSARALAQEGEEVRVLPEWSRNPVHAARSAAHALRTVMRERPKLVVSAGAGMTVPFSAAARLAGADLVFVETMARISNGSLAGRALAPRASAVLVQWPELKAVYPHARVCRPALFETLSSNGAATEGEGTFVAVGTHDQPFDRLLRIVDRAVQAGDLPQPVVAQSGHSTYRPQSFEPHAWLSPDEVRAELRSARYVVSHAGAGIMSASARAGRRPLVLPRRRSAGEHVDDHQLQLVRKLGELDLVVEIDDEIAAAQTRAAEPPLPALPGGTGMPSLQDALRAELECRLTPEGGPSR